MKISDLLASPLAVEILGARLIANLATLRWDGTIDLVPMWFLWDGEAVLMPTSSATRKVRNLERDPRAAVMIDDSRGGLDVRGCTFAGEAEIVRGVAAAEAIRKVHRKYVTEAGLRAESVTDALAGDDVILRFLPSRGSSWDLTGLAAARDLRESREFEPLVPVYGARTPGAYPPEIADSWRGDLRPAIGRPGRRHRCRTSLKNGAPGSSSTVRVDHAGSNISYVPRPSRMPRDRSVSAPIASPIPGWNP